MEAESSSEISLAVYQSIRRHKPGQLNIRQQQCEKLCSVEHVRCVVPARLGSLSCGAHSSVQQG